MKRPRLALLVLLLALLTAAGCGRETTGSDATAVADTAVADTAAVGADRPGWVDEAVVYEVFVRDFSPEGTFDGVTARLDSLQDLGVTTLWLMPIHPVGEERAKGELGSPYAVRDYFDVNPRFGTKADFRALVEAVHERGMYLIIDLVANHTAWDNAWIDDHPDWYTQDASGEIIYPEGTDWTDVADLNYENQALRDTMTAAMTYWVEEFGIDGYRCDVAGEVPLDFWESAIAAVREVKPVMMLAEGDDPALHGAGFGVSYAWPLYGRLKEVWEGEPASAFFDMVSEREAALPAGALQLLFITNHDETAWDAPPPTLFGSQKGARAAATLMLTLPGVPLLYNGQEVGSTQELPLFEKEAINWDQNPETLAFYKDLLALLDEHPALQGDSVNVLAPEADDVALFERTAGGARVVVAVNVRDRAASVDVPSALRGASVTDAFSGEQMTMGASLELPPYGYRLLQVEEGGA